MRVVLRESGPSVKKIRQSAREALDFYAGTD
jgi:hypothetical protein